MNAEIESLRGQFESFARVECEGRSPLYAEICCAVARDDELLALVASTPERQRRPNLLLAAIHFDLEPVDVRDDDAVRWLTACVFPDQPWRVQRLRAALAIAREQPPRIVRGDGRVLIGKLAANGDAQAHPVVWHSLVLAYTYESEQRALTSAIDAVGATTDLTWIYLEVPARTPGLPAPDVMHDGERSDNGALVAVSYRAGRRTVRQLASADAHVARMSWIA